MKGTPAGTRRETTEEISREPLGTRKTFRNELRRGPAKNSGRNPGTDF